MRFLMAAAMVLGLAGATMAQETKASAPGEVVIYTSLDKQFSEPILKEFEARTGITVRPVFDTEAVKTVGLVNRLLAERERPRCDVFWNNEIVRSIQLKEEGLTEAYRSPSAEGIPASLKDPDGHWTGFAARGRVILVNKELIPNEAEWPRRLQDLTDPKWKGRAAFGKPLFGATNTYAAVLWSRAGEEKARAFWEGALANAVMEAGNAQTRDAVAAGEAAWCLTDTDDARGAILDGAPVVMIYPEDDPAGAGVVMIPNTVMLIKNGPNGENGRKLIDFILSEEVEGLLAASRSAQIPVRAGVKGPEGLPELAPERILAVDWQAAYGAIAPSTGWLAQRLAQ